MKHAPRGWRWRHRIFNAIAVMVLFVLSAIVTALAGLAIAYFGLKLL